MWPTIILIAGVVLWTLSIASPLGIVLAAVGAVLLAIQVVLVVAAFAAAASAAKSISRKF